MKWLFTDYDDTISIPAEPETTAKNFKFLKQWNDAGNKVVFSSGRPIEFLKDLSVYENIASEYYISNNGSYTHDKHLNVIDELYISKDNRIEILEILEDEAKRGTNIAYILPDGRNGYSYTEITNFPYGDPKQIQDFFYPNGINETNKKKDILEHNKFLGLYFIGSSKSDLERIAKRFQNLDNVRTILSGSILLEVVPKDTTKSRGVEVVRKKHNIDINDIYTAGDGTNDKEMLEDYTNTFAMECGTEVAKNAAKNIIKYLYELEKLI